MQDAPHSKRLDTDPIGPTAIGSYTLLLARALDAKGISSRELFERAGVPTGAWHDPLQRIPLAVVRRSYENIFDLTGDPCPKPVTSRREPHEGWSPSTRVVASKMLPRIRRVLGRISDLFIASRAGEVWYAWRTSKEMLLCYLNVREGEPGPHGLALYERVLAERGFDRNAITEVVASAQESFCRWPVTRDLHFEDVVHYVAVTSYLRAHPEKFGMRTDLTIAIGRVVSKEL